MQLKHFLLKTISLGFESFERSKTKNIEIFTGDVCWAEKSCKCLLFYITESTIKHSENAYYMRYVWCWMKSNLDTASMSNRGLVNHIKTPELTINYLIRHMCARHTVPVEQFSIKWSFFKFFSFNKINNNTTSSLCYNNIDYVVVIIIDPGISVYYYYQAGCFLYVKAEK